MTARGERYRGAILAHLNASGKTQKWLAKKLGVTEGTFSRKINGKDFTETEMRYIQRVFGWESLEGERE